MTQSWTLSGRVVIKPCGSNLFLFQFFHWRDKEKVLLGCPWCFDHQLLILNEIEANEQPSNTRIYNLPLNCRSDDDVKTIVANYGSIMDIEPDDLGLENFRRVKLKLDVSKPLRRYQRI
ncbi:RNA binding protein fox-1-like protein 3 [Bienertia sinuspersici]